MYTVNNLQDVVDTAIRSRHAGAPLPETVRTALEGLFGADFRSVRVHTVSALAGGPARAFACGDDLFFAPGEYVPGTADGWATLGHELAHVVQQRCGRAGTRPVGSPEVILDPRLEVEADRAGEAAAALFTRGLRPHRPIAPPGVPDRACVCAAQFMMTLNQFVAKTTTPDRTPLANIDAALTDYHQAIDRQPFNGVTALAKARQVNSDCMAYRRTGGAMAGVDELLKQTILDISVIEPLAKAYRAPDFIQKWDYVDKAFLNSVTMGATGLGTALDRYQTSLRQQYFTQNLNDANYLAMVAHYIRELIKIMEGPTTHRILKSIMAEVLDVMNLAKCDFQNGNSAVSYNDVGGGLPVKAGATAKYTLKLGVANGCGKRDFLGSLLHELTHVSISESYNNTPIMLSVLYSATDKQWKQLCKKRNKTINNIKRLIQKSDRTAAIASLGSWCTSKLDYAIGPKIGDYINLLRQMTAFPTQYARIKGLYDNQEIGSELVEYDTTVNQSLLWCHIFGLSEKSSVFKALLEAAEEAYLHRASARRGVHLS